MEKTVKRLMAILVTIGALAAMAAGPSGCRKLDAAGIVVESYPSTKITVNSRIFGKWFEVTQSALARGDNGLLRATISVRNVKKECQVEYRYRWIDKDGIEVTTGTAIWTAMSVAARETALMTGVAPSRQAVDFILDIRFPHKSTRW